MWGEDKTMSDLLGTTAYNRPHKSGIHYSAKGYDEFRADLSARLEQKEFVLRKDDFLNAFVDLTAYMGEVLITYQNAYAQEIYLETAQLRESLFNFALMVDYSIDPGAAAAGTIIIYAKPDKSGTINKGFQISGKEEGADKKVFFETDKELKVHVDYNDFTLTPGERYNLLVISDNILVKDKLIVKPGSYLYFDSTPSHLFAQVQSSSVDEDKKTTSITWDNSTAYSTVTDSETVGNGDWGFINAEAKDLLKLQASADNIMWLDEKIENISASDPVILKSNGGTDYYGIVTGITFEMATVKTGEIQWISENPAGAGETFVYSYTIKVEESGTSVDKTFYALKKDITESREVTKLEVNWIGPSTPSAYNTTTVLEKSPNHTVYAGISKKLDIETKEKNSAYMNGLQTLNVSGDFSGMEKYRTLILHEKIDGVNETEEVCVREITYNDGKKTSYIDLRSSISRQFTKYGVKIWGNVAAVTQGKSIPDTVLGSGRGDESYQSFELPQSPLTFERSGSEGIKAALEIWVHDLLWEQKENFLYSGPEDHHYVIETDYEGKSRVIFGNGINGSRLPTGKDNVTAQFQIGQGTGGNVSDKILKKPTSKPAFLKEAFNTGKTSGGSDADTEEELREKIPVEHLTFDRAVSLSDYSDLALAYSGVGKAKAGWRWINNRQVVYLAVAGEEGQDPTGILEDLRADLDAKRDINQPLIVAPVTLVPVTIIMEAVALEDFDKDLLKNSIIKVLGTGKNDDGALQFFAFERLDMGVSIHKKDIYGVVTKVTGVKGIKSLSIRRSTACTESGYMIPSLCSEDVWINNWELASLDKTALDIQILKPPAGKICETLGI